MRATIPIEAVIFDIDGTLVDSVDLHAESWRLAFKEFGKTVPLPEIRRQIGKGADQLMPVFWSKDELKKIGPRLKEYRSELFKKDFLPQVKPFPGVRTLFKRVMRDGKRIALASSAQGDELEAYKKIAGIDDLIKAETSSDDAEKSKPHADIFEAALGKLEGMTPDRVIVVGDTPYDAEAAAKAGLRTLGLRSGGWKESDLRRAGCIAVYRDTADLLEHYEASPLHAPLGEV